MSQFQITADIHTSQLEACHVVAEAEWSWTRQHTSSARDYASRATYHGKPAPEITRAESIDLEPVIPDPGLFQSLHDDTIDARPATASLPTAATMAVHLKMLEAFHALKLRVVTTNALEDSLGMDPYKIAPRQVFSEARKWEVQPTMIKNQDYLHEALNKWPLFLDLAVGRFEIWAGKIEAEMRRQGSDEKSAVLPHLPPLDILAAWHAYLLNPGDYRQYCRDHDLKYLRQVRFPWKRIYNALESRTIEWHYTLDGPSKSWFQKATALPHNLFDTIAKANSSPNAPLARAVRLYGGIKLPETTLEAELKKIGPTHTDYPFITLLRSVMERSTLQPSLRIKENIVRQGDFTAKMHDHLWIRSPAAEGTLVRARERYDNFARLFRKNPGSVLVPTLDIDLAWHTHQASAAAYEAWVIEIAGRFIDHDDKISQGALNRGEGVTNALYESVYDEEYLRCLCWDCEAILSAVEGTDDDVNLDEEHLKDVGIKIREDMHFYRTVEMARRQLTTHSHLPVRPARGGK